jgi:hypothetical protein
MKGGICVLQNVKEIKRRVSVNLTDGQKEELKSMSDALGINVNVLLNFLIRYFIYGTANGNLTLESLLIKYQKLQRDTNNKTRKITLRIKEEEFKKFNVLANQWLYLPGELAGILTELLIAGIIDINSIWNIPSI